MAATYKHITVVIVLAFTIGIISSCNNHKDKQAKPVRDSVISISKNLSVADSLQLVHDIDSADYAYLFKNQVNIWVSKALNNPAIKWTNFALADFREDDDVKQANGELPKRLLDDYSMFLRWNPDSSYVLDFGSYGAVIDKDKNGQQYINDGEIDNEIRLYNRKMKTSSRLIFDGPGSHTWDARWADGDQVAILGTFDTTNGRHIDTTLWLINVKTNFFRKYNYTKH